jgi:hypothetical protein
VEVWKRKRRRRREFVERVVGIGYDYFASFSAMKRKQRFELI